MPDKPLYCFSVAELLVGVFAIAVGLAFPVMLPAVACIILIRVGVGFWQSILLSLVGFGVTVMFVLPYFLGD
jgi:hypothetical protein